MNNNLRDLAVRILEFDDDEKEEFLKVLKSQAYQWSHRAMEEWAWSSKIIDMVNTVEEKKREEKERAEKRRKLIENLNK